MYKVPCYWEMGGYLYIEAGSPSEARDIALSDTTALPDDADYLSDSFTVEEDWIEEVK
jgi:hypothetical protein